MVNSNMAEKGKSGHRQRLRERFLAGETELRSDEKLLELLLTFAIGRKDVLPLARELLQTFGSLSQVLSASQDELFQVKGVGDSSLTLLKMVDVIREESASKNISPQTQCSQEREALQQPLFENLSEEIAPPQASGPTGLTPTTPTNSKLQLSNGHELDFNHVARVITSVEALSERRDLKMEDLAEETGLPARQARNRVSVIRALGLLHKKQLSLTPLGRLVCRFDPFCESIATLEYLHYTAAGSPENLVWFEIFNHLLAHEELIDAAGWQKYFRRKFVGRWSEYSLRKHSAQEIRFVLNAYNEQQLQKLLLLHQDPEGRIYRRRYTSFTPLVLCAMLYDFCAARNTHVAQVDELLAAPGSPALLFGLDIDSFRQQIEGLHQRGLLRYESAHNLDQIRLKSECSALQFLTMHFEGEEKL
ncbi:MAG: DUF4007 family protein [bacterium]|nr:DUF4007 family protein [bacterium]